VFRHTATSYECLSARGASLSGGRYNRTGSFQTLYCALSRDVAAAELARRARFERCEIVDFLPRKLCVVEVSLRKVLDLRSDAALARLGLSAGDLTSDDVRICQALGHAAKRSGAEGMLAPSATHHGDVLVIFVDNLPNPLPISVQQVDLWLSPGDVAAPVL
jgi:RES domain-containing protein